MNVMRNSNGPIRSSDIRPIAPRYARILGSVLAVVILQVLPTRSAAQISSVGGALEGTVTDNSGQPIPNAEVRTSNVTNGRVRLAIADSQGFFRVSDLPVGTCDVAVAEAGFAPYLQTGVEISLGQTVRLEIRLSPAKLVQKVTVTAQPPTLNASDTTATTTVGRERIEELPVRSRNALDFVLLSPGVAGTNPQQAGSATGGLAASGFTFGGLRPRSNSLSIDGLDNNDEFSGGSRTELSPEIVQEFQVVNNGLSAEYGGASGGAIDVVTRTGTNTTHGDAFIFLQSGALNGQEPLTTENQKPTLFLYRTGLSRGGPIVKDRTFYYAAFEQEHIRSETASDIDPAVATPINAFLATGNLPQISTRQLTEGFFPIARAETEASGKLDHQLSDRHSLALRYAFTNNKEPGDAFNSDGLTDASARGSSFADDHALVGSLTSSFRASAVNELRFQFARRRVTLRTNDRQGPGVLISGIANFGRSYEGNSHHREDHAELSDTLALSEGRALLKLGGTVNHVHENVFAPDGFGAIFIFPSLPDFFNETPDVFRQVFGNPRTAFGVTAYGAFYQDHWTINRRTTVDLGLRYNFEHLPSGFNEDSNNFSPRIGVAFSPSSRWVWRAGYGIFFDRYVLANLNNAIEKNGVAGMEQVAEGPAAASILSASQGGPLAAPFPGFLPSVFRPDPHLATPYSQQANFEAQYLISNRFTVSADYLFARGIKLSRTLNSNLLPPVVLTPQNAASLGVASPTPQQIGREVFGAGRLDPLFNDIESEEDSANSTYNGLSITLERHLEDFTLSTSYTLSRTADDASDFWEQPQNSFNLHDERALSLDHQEQRFVLSGLFELPFGNEEEIAAAVSGVQRFAGVGQGGGPAIVPGGKRRGFLTEALSNLELGPIVELGSGRPVNPLTGTDSNRNDAFPLSSRPRGFGRNTLQTPALFNLDLRLLKSIYFAHGSHLDLVVESFNLLNHTNVTELNPIFGSGAAPIPGFSRPIEALNARQVEFSIDFEY
jgi:carboxypeptidase family protein/TonB-dependent receptor-like protein